MFDEFKNAFQRYNNGHIQLIIINIVVFLVMAIIYVGSNISGVPDIFQTIEHQVAIPASFASFIVKPWTIITYAFMHDLHDIWHIVFNMLTFYWFAKLIVEYLGNDKLIALYFLGAIAGGVTYLLAYNVIPFYIVRNAGYMIGASAAVNAVMVAAATLLPDYTFNLMFIGPVRIKYIAAFFVVVSFIGSVSQNAGGNIAHLGGALMGFIYVRQLQAGVNWGGWVTSVIEFFKNIFKPSSKVKVTYRKETRKESAGSAFGKASQVEIDRILDKISDKGYESLTKEEKEKLFNASKKP